MITPRILIVATFLAVSANQAYAQTMLDLLPRDAAAGIAIRDLDDLIKKGDKFLTDTDIKIGLRPSELFDQGTAILGVQKGLDRKGAAAVVLIPPEGKKFPDGLDWLERSIVPILPFTDA